MGLSRTDLTSVFTQTWVDALKAVPELGMSATVTISDPSTAESTWAPGTGLVTSPDEWYSGIARIQPIRSSTYGEGTRYQALRVSIPVDNTRPAARVGFTLKVDSAPLNPELEEYLAVCTEVADGSNPLERTLVFTVNHGLRA